MPFYVQLDGVYIKFIHICRIIALVASNQHKLLKPSVTLMALVILNTFPVMLMMKLPDTLMPLAKLKKTGAVVAPLVPWFRCMALIVRNLQSFEVAIGSALRVPIKFSSQLLFLGGDEVCSNSTTAYLGLASGTCLFSSLITRSRSSE